MPNEVKDFLFFNYHWVENSTFYFESFKKKGHTFDIVDERNLSSFVPKCEYKNVVLYLHEGWTIPITNRIIDLYCKNSTLIQHDDTDFEDVQVWSNRRPDAVMQRELTKDTKNPWGCPVEPFHFPAFSLYDKSEQTKNIDVCFLGNMTHLRRIPFARHIIDLANGKLSHLKWAIKITPLGSTHDPSIFKNVINRSKIGLHYFGNSYDAHRIWQLTSTKTAIIMPWMRNLSVDKDHMHFTEYCQIRDDFSDLEEKIVYLLEQNRYKNLAESAFSAYTERHNPEKCFEYYYSKIMKYAKI